MRKSLDTHHVMQVAARSRWRSSAIDPPWLAQAGTPPLPFFGYMLIDVKPGIVLGR
jgi:hypothetical protein